MIRRTSRLRRIDGGQVWGRDAEDGPLYRWVWRKFWYEPKPELAHIIGAHEMEIWLRDDRTPAEIYAHGGLDALLGGL